MMASQIVVVERVARQFRPPRTPARSRVGDIVRWNRSYPRLAEIRPQPNAHVFSPSLLGSAPNVCENIAFVERFSFHGGPVTEPGRFCGVRRSARGKNYGITP